MSSYFHFFHHTGGGIFDFVNFDFLPHSNHLVMESPFLPSMLQPTKYIDQPKSKHF
jgi:hypothetical protein